MLGFHYKHWGVGAYCDNASIPCNIFYYVIESRVQRLRGQYLPGTIVHGKNSDDIA